MDSSPGVTFLRPIGTAKIPRACRKPSRYILYRARLMGLDDRIDVFFPAEFTRQGVQVLEFAGTIDSLGQVNWRVDRVVSGASTRNLVAGLVGKGRVKGNMMSLSYRIEGDNQFGEIEMKLKE